MNSDSPTSPGRPFSVHSRATLKAIVDVQVARTKIEIVDRIDFILAELRDPFVSPARRTLGLDVIRVLNEDLALANPDIAALRAELSIREKAFAEHEDRLRKQKAAEKARLEKEHQVRKQKIEAKAFTATENAKLEEKGLDSEKLKEDFERRCAENSIKSSRYG